jgi:hypothetical protein
MLAQYTVLLFLLSITLCKSQSGIISGQGDYVFEYDSATLQNPLFKLIQPAQLANGHGLARDDSGNLYFTFQATTVTSSTQALVRFSDGLQTATLIGDPKLAIGTPHGLRIENDMKANKWFLYHANNAHIVTKTTLDGEIVWMTNLTDWQTMYPQYWPILPTDAIVVPDTDILLVADGYGSSYIHLFDKNTGEYMKQSWGGPGKSNNPVKLQTPHGINVDPRVKGTTPAFVICDRSNNRFVWTDYKGTFIDEEPITAPGMTLPCNVDIVIDKYTNAMVGVTPSLGDQTQSAFVNGSVSIFSAGIGSQSTILSRIEVEPLIGYLGHQHPHDAVLLSNGDLVVCCWSGPSDGPIFGPAKGTISYWKRVMKK